MLHHAHAYFASKLYDSEDPYLIAGSIIPDLAVTKIIPWKNGLHEINQAELFYQFCKRKYPQYLNLAKGVISHHFLDEFSHSSYKGNTGFAFQNNQELVKLVTQFYGIDKQSAEGKAHNYIESAVDILLIEDLPEARSICQHGLAGADVNKVSMIIADFFHEDSNLYSTSVFQFFDLLTKYTFVSLNEWSSFWSELEKLLSLKNIGDTKRAKLLNLAMDITKDRHKDFMKYSLSYTFDKTNEYN